MSDIVFESTYENIKEFVQDRDLPKLMQLCLYISGSEALNRPPTELEKEFITEFFTDHGWAGHVQMLTKKKRGDDIYFYNPPFDLPNIMGILNYEIMHMAYDAILIKNRLLQSVNELKQELENGLDAAVYDGVFDKVDGFSNIYEALIKHDMVQGRED